MPHVPAVAELGNVFPSVLCRNVDVGSLDGAFEQGPVAFQRVGMVNAPHIFLEGVVDRAVSVDFA